MAYFLRWKVACGVIRPSKKLLSIYVDDCATAKIRKLLEQKVLPGLVFHKNQCKA